nr:MAG TPA: DBC1 [Caudoviricetes sp.]
MIDIDSVSREVSKETGYDLDIVKKVCQHVFK